MMRVTRRQLIAWGINFILALFIVSVSIAIVKAINKSSYFSPVPVKSFTSTQSSTDDVYQVDKQDDQVSKPLPQTSEECAAKEQDGEVSKSLTKTVQEEAINTTDICMLLLYIFVWSVHLFFGLSK
jgi:hypothetical protein